jgi:hypothetical protein
MSYRGLDGLGNGSSDFVTFLSGLNRFFVPEAGELATMTNTFAHLWFEFRQQLMASA